MKKPNFFIIGAGKCGTTALYTYLKRHQQIFMPDVKEPGYFADDFDGVYIRDYDQYLRLFEDASDNHLAVGEATPFYLRSKSAPRRIREWDNQAKIIIMLRNPVDRVYSLHAQLVSTFEEEITAFECAWRMPQPEAGKTATGQPKRSRDYKDLGKLSPHIQRWQEYFPPHQIKIILFDDFKADTRAVYLDVLNFLGIPDDGCGDFPRINENQVWRNKGMGRLLTHPPAPIRKMIRWYKMKLGIQELKFKSRLIQLYSSPMERTGLPPALKQEMLQEFDEEINQIGIITGRDVSHWKK